MAAMQNIQKTCDLAPKKYPFFHLAKADVFLGLNNHPAAVTELEAYLKEEPDGQGSLQVKQTLDKLRATSSPN